MCMKFCLKLWRDVVETFELLNPASDDECLSHARTFEWFRRFKEG